MKHLLLFVCAAVTAAQATTIDAVSEVHCGHIRTTGYCSITEGDFIATAGAGGSAELSSDGTTFEGRMGASSEYYHLGPLSSRGGSSGTARLIASRPVKYFSLSISRWDVQLAHVADALLFASVGEVAAIYVGCGPFVCEQPEILPLYELPSPVTDFNINWGGSVGRGWYNVEFSTTFYGGTPENLSLVQTYLADIKAIPEPGTASLLLPALAALALISRRAIS